MWTFREVLCLAGVFILAIATPRTLLGQKQDEHHELCAHAVLTASEDEFRTSGGNWTTLGPFRVNADDGRTIQDFDYQARSVFGREYSPPPIPPSGLESYAKSVAASLVGRVIAFAGKPAYTAPLWTPMYVPIAGWVASAQVSVSKTNETHSLDIDLDVYTGTSDGNRKISLRTGTAMYILPDPLLGYDFPTPALTPSELEVLSISGTQVPLSDRQKLQAIESLCKQRGWRIQSLGMPWRDRLDGARGEKQLVGKLYIGVRQVLSFPVGASGSGRQYHEFFAHKIVSAVAVHRPTTRYQLAWFSPLDRRFWSVAARTAQHWVRSFEARYALIVQEPDGKLSYVPPSQIWGALVDPSSAE